MSLYTYAPWAISGHPCFAKPVAMGSLAACGHGQPGSLWPRCEAHAHAPSASQERADSRLVTRWCLLCAWRCYSYCLGLCVRAASACPCTLVSPCFSPLFSTSSEVTSNKISKSALCFSSHMDCRHWFSSWQQMLWIQCKFSLALKTAGEHTTTVSISF